MILNDNIINDNENKLYDFKINRNQRIITDYLYKDKPDWFDSLATDCQGAIGTMYVTDILTMYVANGKNVGCNGL